MEEYFTIVGPEDTKNETGPIVPYGCVARNLAHSPFRVPHTAVQIVPVQSGTMNVYLHRRSERVRNSPGLLDVFGGHVSFEMGILAGPQALAEASLETAVREAREEILVTAAGKPHFIRKEHFRQVGDVGQFKCNEETNREYSTAFVLSLPSDSIVGDSPFESRSHGLEWLPVTKVDWFALLQDYDKRKNAPADTTEAKKKYADGVERILRSSEEIRNLFEDAIGSC